jgi:CrcB protein
VQKYIYILTGGAAGAVLRVLIRNINLFSESGGIPINTLMINITGAFVLVFFLTTAFEVFALSADMRTGISTGFLGAFTTFSALCKETAGMINNGEYFYALSYIALSVTLGLFTAYAGYLLAEKMTAKLRKRDKKRITDTEET